MKKGNKVFTIYICFSILLLAGFIGCDSTNPTSGYSQKDAAYLITCGSVECYDTDDQETSISQGYNMKKCQWCCGNYKGQERKNVILTFKQLAGSETDCWILDSEFVSEGICN